MSACHRAMPILPNQHFQPLAHSPHQPSVPALSKSSPLSEEHVTPAPSNRGAPYWGGFARRAPKFGRLKSVFEQAVATVPTVGDTLKTLDYHHPPREESYQHWTGVPSPALITPSERKIRHATQNRRHSPSGQGLDSPRHDRPKPLIVHGPHDIKGATGTNRPDPHQLKRPPQALPCNNPLALQPPISPFAYFRSPVFVITHLRVAGRLV